MDAIPAGSDYYLDAQEAETWVWDPSMESLSLINEILCYVQQTAASDMVNEGAYIALVNEDKCEEGENQSSASSGGAQSTASSSQSTEYSKWTVLSTREDNSSPQIVKIWVPGDDDADHPMDAQRILVTTTITEGVSDDKPYGSFVLNFVGEAPLGPDNTYIEVMQGTLKTVENDEGKPEFTLFNNGGGDELPFTMIEKSHVVMDDASGTSGQAKTYMYERFVEEGFPPFEKESGFSVAYADDHFLRGKDSDGDASVDEQVCTSRNDFSTQTWRYNLYHTADGTFNQASVTAGQRVALNSGFPFVYDDGTESHFGHIGYWGIWTENELDLTDLADQTITRERYGDSDSSAEEFTVKVSGGKLWRRTKVASSYEEVVGVDLNWWGDPNDITCSSESCSQADYRATVVESEGSYSLKVTHSLEWGNNSGPTLTELDTPVDITPVNDWEQRWLWGDSLGGSVVFKPAGSEDAVVMFKEEVVSPDEDGLPSELYCYERCLKGGMDAETVLESESDLFHILWNGDENTQDHVYTLSVENGQFVLTDESSNPVVVDFTIPDGIGEWYEWGINTGEMTATAAANWWEVFDADVTYRWETGQNSWNRAVAVINNSTSEPQSFDKPMHFKYVFAAGDDPNGDNHTVGTPFMLEYGGEGQLWGFPWTKQEEDCDEDSENCRWISTLTLKNGVELSIGEDDYLVLPMESEQTMTSVDLAECTDAGLDVAGIDLSLPSAVSGSVDFSWSDKPQVTDAPAVIEGEVQ
jgi:hypothetical protein